MVTVVVVSDLHYASDAEKARGLVDARAVDNALLRVLVKWFRHFIWMRDPYAHNHLIDELLSRVAGADYLVANGDYSCDSSFVGVSDRPTFESARECLNKLRAQFGSRLAPTLGDHELGKTSLFGHKGGLRLASWQSATEELGIVPFWQVAVGVYRLIGVASSLVALPVYEPETLANERAEWWRIRAEHMAQISDAFSKLTPQNRVLLFCHDPTALPFLWEEEAVRRNLPLIERTIIGHFHSKAVFWKSRLLAGMPTIHFLGTSIRRMSAALNRARVWKNFRVALCPSLAGIELLKDGGYYQFDLDPEGRMPPAVLFHRLKTTVRNNTRSEALSHG